MFAKRTIYFIVPLAFFAASIPIQRGYSQVTEQCIVRIAELEIDPNQLMAYKAALKEEIETSIRVELGVLALYAVSVKAHPNQSLEQSNALIPDHYHVRFHPPQGCTRTTDNKVL